MNDLHVAIKFASNAAFALAVLFMGVSWFFEHEIVSFVLIRLGVFLAGASVFWGVYGQIEGNKTMKQIWDEKSTAKGNSFTGELYLNQPLLFSLSGVVLALYKNPWL